MHKPTKALFAVVATLLIGGCSDSTTPVASPSDAADGITSDVAADTAVASDATSDAAPDATPDVPSSPGPFVAPAVGVIETTFVTDAGLELELVIWYPAGTPPESLEPKQYFFILQGTAYEGAAPLAGNWPLILFSHGSQAIPQQSIDLCEAWARAGYVVAAPSHPGNTLLDNSLPMGEVAQRRPLDLVATRKEVERLDADPAHPLYDRIDETLVATAGHSFGGMTTLISAGAAIDVVGAKAACDSGVNLRGACGLIQELDVDLYTIRPPELDDVAAAIALSPAFHVIFGAVGLAEITAPTFIAVGDKDTITPSDTEALPIYADLPTSRALARFFDVGHYGFSNFCDVPNIEDISDGQIECNADAFTPHRQVMEITAELTIPFLDKHLKGIEGSDQHLVDEATETTWPDLLEIRYELTD